MDARKARGGGEPHLFDLRGGAFSDGKSELDGHRPAARARAREDEVERPAAGLRPDQISRAVGDAQSPVAFHRVGGPLELLPDRREHGARRELR